MQQDNNSIKSPHKLNPISKNSKILKIILNQRKLKSKIINKKLLKCNKKLQIYLKKLNKNKKIHKRWMVCKKQSSNYRKLLMSQQKINIIYKEKQKDWKRCSGLRNKWIQVLKLRLTNFVIFQVSTFHLNSR